MENASKALIMAGSVLLAILIIGALVYTFNLMSNLKTTEQRSAEAEKLVKPIRKKKNLTAKAYMEVKFYHYAIL